MRNLLALDLNPPGKPFRGFGPLGLEGRLAGESPLLFASIISSVIGIITVVGIIWFVFTVIIGAIGIISSGGDKNKVAEARAKITYGLVGLVITISAIFLVQLFGTLMGIDFLNIQSAIINVKF